MTQITDVQLQLKSIPKRWPRVPLHLSQRKILLIGVDLFLLNASFLLGYLLSLDMPWSVSEIALYPLWFAPLNLLWLTIAWISDSYDIKKAARVSSSVFGILKALLITGAIYAIPGFFFPQLLARQLPTLRMGLLAAGLLTLWRIVYATVLVQSNFQRLALIVGAGKTGRKIAQAIEEHNTGYEILGYVFDETLEESQDHKERSNLVDWEELPEFVQEHGVSDIILAVHRDMQPDLLEAVLKCFEQGVCIVTMPELYEELTGRIPVEHIGDRWLGSLPIDWDSGKRRLYIITKRAIDLGISFIGLLVLAPVFPLVAVAIKLDSPGPIFYRPERMGQGGKPFCVWKFRTMVTNADRLGDPTFTAKNDQRVTRVGRILRTIHLDELPQFINVITGEMSLVGPRPERHVPELDYRLRYAVKPGATGWALVMQGYAEGVDGTLLKLQYDLYYIKHQSLYLDVLIILKSIIHMLTMGGQ